MIRWRWRFFLANLKAHAVLSRRETEKKNEEENEKREEIAPHNVVPNRIKLEIYLHAFQNNTGWKLKRIAQ